MKKGKDPDPYLRLTDPDLGDPKGSGRYGTVFFVHKKDLALT
jgi:hypothetical protein